METKILEFTISNKSDEKLAADKFITENSTLDPLVFNTNISVQNGTIIRLWAEAVISYTQNGRNDSFSFSIELPPYPGSQSGSYTFSDNDLRGGTVYYIGKALVRNNYNQQEQVYSTAQQQFNIRAIQPKEYTVHDAISQECDGIYSLIYYYSKFKIFNKEKMPIYNNGFGLFASKNLDAGQIWNWKRDLAINEKKFLEKQKIANKIPAFWRSTDPEFYKFLLEFTSKQLTVETIQSYGTGTYYMPKRDPIVFDRWHWVPSGQNDGFADKVIHFNFFEKD